MRRLLGVATLAFCCAATGCGGILGGSNNDSASSPTAPANPANTTLAGTWTGTMTRPAGKGPIGIRWAATQDGSGQLGGAFQMTLNGATLSATFNGIFQGGSNNPGAVMFRLVMNKGDTPSLPTCSLTMGSPGLITGFSTAPTQLTSAEFSIGYEQCNGFIAPTPPANYTSEPGSVLTLSR